MKKIISALLSLTVFFTGCSSFSSQTPDILEIYPSNSSEKYYTDMEYEGWTIEQYIENSQNIFWGTCTNITERKDNHVGVIGFQIKRVLKGDYDPEFSDFMTSYSEAFTLGQEYLIFCNKEASVFSGSDFYGISLVLFDQNGKLVNEAIQELTAKTVLEVNDYIGRYMNLHPATDDGRIRYGDYCRSENLIEIYNYSSYALLLKITDILDNQLDDRTTYSFSVSAEYKGHVKDEEWLIAQKDSLHVGEEYLLLLNKPDATALFFIPSSRSSIYAADSAEVLTIATLKK